MKKILENLEKRGFNLTAMRALEVFAREGDWQTVVYASKVKSLTAWEVDVRFGEGLRRNLPNAEIKITDSIQEISQREHFGRYDFIVVDNPQNCYGDQRQYCEHFDVIPAVCRLFDQGGILIFNINKQPFNFKSFPDWQKRRTDFYGLADTSLLSIDWLVKFYKKLLADFGWQTVFCYNVSRGDFEHNDYLYYLVFCLKKKQ